MVWKPTFAPVVVSYDESQSLYRQLRLALFFSLVSHS
jgi:hypothetical protein